MSEVVLHSVTKRYRGGIIALNAVDLAADEGRLLVLLGPSGCGKTTTLRLIAGLEKPDKGTILVGGRDVRGVPPHGRCVALVFQDAALYPHMNVRRNLAFALRIMKLPRTEIDDRIHQTADMLRIRHLLDRRPATLSGGELQRVALGRAIARRPRVLLLDEPMSDLDERLRLALRTEMKSLQRRLGITTIHVTHDQHEAMALADRIAIMARGRIHQVASPEEIYEHPGDRFVAAFVGSPPMNFLEGRIERAGGEPVFLSDSLRLPLRTNALLTSNGNIPVTLGIRPQHLPVVSRESSGRQGVVPCTVTLTERLGAQRFVHAQTEGGLRLIASLDGDRCCDPGDHIALCPDSRHLHFFEPNPEGRRL